MTTTQPGPMSRTRTAEALADAITAAHPDVTTEALAVFAGTGMLDWALAAQHAGTVLPDTATRCLTAANLRNRPARHLTSVGGVR